jgi:Domain of unknown function (DUF4149)
MTYIRFLMLLSLIVWLGGIIFFSLLAPTSFSVLPTRHLAGAIVGSMLSKLHWIGVGAGLVFLFASIASFYFQTGTAHVFAPRHLLITLMLILTLISQLTVSPKMTTLRTSIGEIDSVSPNDPARVQFDALHAWSTRLEVGVLLLGLSVVYLAAANCPDV